MLKPKKNAFITAFFKTYILWLLKRHFRAIHISTLPLNDKPVMLLANHFTWWDGFLLWYMNNQVLKRRFYVMVLEKTLLKQGFMRYLGAYSVADSSRGVLESLRYTAGLLTHPENTVLIFPQGKIHSNFSAEIGFKKGVGEIARLAGADFQYVFAAMFTENLQYKKPSVWIELEAHDATVFSSVKAVEEAYNRHYATALNKQQRYEA